MTYTLKPKRRGQATFDCNVHFWSWLLSTGVGLAIGCGPSFKEHHYFYQMDEKGRAPQNNDGFMVSAKQAKMMGNLAAALGVLEQERAESFSAMPQALRDVYQSEPNVPAPEGFRQQLAQFATWALNSGGFEVH